MGVLERDNKDAGCCNMETPALRERLRPGKLHARAKVQCPSGEKGIRRGVPTPRVIQDTLIQPRGSVSYTDSIEVSIKMDPQLPVR